MREAKNEFDPPFFPHSYRKHRTKVTLASQKIVSRFVCARPFLRKPFVRCNHPLSTGNTSVKLCVFEGLFFPFSKKPGCGQHVSLLQRPKASILCARATMLPQHTHNQTSMQTGCQSWAWAPPTPRLPPPTPTPPARHPATAPHSTAPTLRATAGPIPGRGPAWRTGRAARTTRPHSRGRRRRERRRQAVPAAVVGEVAGQASP